LQLVSSLADEETPLEGVKSALWDPHQEGNIIAADSENLKVFQGAGTARFSCVSTLNVGQRCNGACMDPHHTQQVSTVDDTHLKTWDLRASRKAFSREGAHLFGARDVDYNQNVPYQVMTTGEDATIRFWDLRQLSECRLSLSGGHHHWIGRARYNSHHDQLVLSSGTDSAVCLWRAGSVASKPLGAEPPKANSDSANNAPDGLIKRFEEHEDSCYSCCWSASDAWVFTSISFDGKLVVNRVPGEEKYRILL
jgi:WD40 repeat protein